MFELARCCWGSSFHLSEPANFSQCVQLPGSVPHDSFNRDGTPVAAQKFRSHVLGQICWDSGTTLKSNTWPLLKLSQLHVLSELENEEDCGLLHSNCHRHFMFIFNSPTLLRQGVCVWWTIWRDVICLTCLISRLLGLTFYLFLAIICRAPGTHDCLPWPTKTRQHGGVNVPAFSISNFLSWQPAKTRTGVSIIWIYIFFPTVSIWQLHWLCDGSSLIPFQVSSPTHAIPVRYNGSVFCT